MLGNQQVIALEEHYRDEVLCQRMGRAFGGVDFAKRLSSFGELRLESMDRAGIDFQVLSHAPPGLQAVDSSEALVLARTVNDRLFEAVQANPTRLGAFASLPTSDPSGAVDELERSVQKLGFLGAMVHGPTGGRFLDDKMFWPLLAAAEALDVPIYLHPADPLQAVQDSYFGDLAYTYPNFLRAAWGFTIETATHAIRLILSGALDAHPHLKVILGHMGEAIPFLIPRIDEALSRDKEGFSFRDAFRRHFHVTTSGFFSDNALRCCIEELGIDRVMFSVDWPYASNEKASAWISGVSLTEEDKGKVLAGNAKRLLRLP